MLAEDIPFLEPFDQEALAEERRYLDLDLEGELARLERLRAEHLALLAGLDGAGWELTGRHGQHGDMTVELYETHVAAEGSTTWPRSPGCGSPGTGPPCGLARRRRVRSGGAGFLGTDRGGWLGRSPEQRALKIPPWRDAGPTLEGAVAWTRW
jgi:hypothetical protein